MSHLWINKYHRPCPLLPAVDTTRSAGTTQCRDYANVARVGNGMGIRRPWLVMKGNMLGNSEHFCDFMNLEFLGRAHSDFM